MAKFIAPNNKGNIKATITGGADTHIDLSNNEGNFDDLVILDGLSAAELQIFNLIRNSNLESNGKAELWSESLKSIKLASQGQLDDKLKGHFLGKFKRIGDFAVTLVSETIAKTIAECITRAK